MATSRKLSLTRDQLATFLGDQEQIRQFERLFQTVDSIAPNVVEEINQVAGNAQASANEALAQLTRIANALELIATAPVIQNNNSLATDYIDLNERTPLPADKPGRAYWNRDDGTMDLDQYGGTVLQVGQELQYYAKNTSGGLITNGTPVMFTGAIGASGKLTFGKAVANGTVLADYMMGVATQDIPNNEFGYITNFGTVRGFNATGSPYGETWADGDLIYFDPATPGTWTKFKPAAPNIDVPVAVVINAGAGGSGSIFVRMTVAESLSRLQDVYINGTGTPLNNDSLFYDSTDKRWENKAPADARTSLGLGSGTPTNGRVLIGNGTNFTLANLTAGANVSIANGAGSITISASAPAPFGAATPSGANAATFSGTLPTGSATSTNLWAQVNIGGTAYWIPIWAV
jgi:hypothetical protein